MLTYMTVTYASLHRAGWSLGVKPFCTSIKWSVSPGFKWDAKSHDNIPTFDEYGSKNFFFFLRGPLFKAHCVNTASQKCVNFNMDVMERSSQCLISVYLHWALNPNANKKGLNIQGFRCLNQRNITFLLLLLLRVDTYFSSFSSNQWTD